MSGSTPVDLWNTADSSDTDESLVSFHICLTKFADSHEFSLSKVELEKKISEIKDWVEKQKKSSDEKAKKELVQNMGKFATSTVSGIQRMGSGDVPGGTLEIISGVGVFIGEVVGGPIGAAIGAIIGTICSIIGAIFGASQPQQPSLIEQVAEVVHRELVEFNSRLQDQRYDGLKRRVSDQSSQLLKMKRGEKLDDPNLWNDYVQFMGELGHRIQSPLPYKYEDILAKDADVADFVTALMTYCQAFGCFNALLITAKGTFARLGKKYNEDDKRADRKITSQMQDLKEKLAFLFDEKYLTFLGRLPSEGGKLTKLVAFSRDQAARHLAEMATRGFGFPKLPDYNTVESKAEIVSRQSVKLKLERHSSDRFKYSFDFTDFCLSQFINETPYPLKVVGNTVLKTKYLPFTQVVQRRSSVVIPLTPTDSGGYVIIYMDGKLRSDDEPHGPDVTHIIEVAWRSSVGEKGDPGVNIQDKTYSEFTKGKDTYDKMNEEEKTIYWKTEEGSHYMANAVSYKMLVPGGLDPFPNLPNNPYSLGAPRYRFRFLFQDFDPIHDVVTADKGRVHNDTSLEIAKTIYKPIDIFTLKVIYS